MLTPDQIKQIESLLKISGLSEAISSTEPATITIPAGALFSDDEIATLKNNEYKRGKETGVEMSVKEVKEKHGLDFQGKTLDGLISAIKAKTLEDAKIEPAEKVKELEGKITTLQTTVKEYETKLSEKDNEVVSIKTNTEILKHIPESTLSQEKVLKLMELDGYSSKWENGKLVHYKDGQPLTDKLSNPLATKDVVTSYMKEQKLITEEQQPGGRGGQDRKPAAMAGSISELKKQYLEQNKSPNGEDFAKEVAQLKKDNPEFKME